jgi:hypothetical protein
MKCQYHICNNPVSERRAKYCSTKCSVNANSIKSRHRIKLRCCEYKGGRCADCDYSDLQYLDVFDFHHLDPNEKDFSLGGTKRSWHKIQPELDKCVMLCARCHRIRHAKENAMIEIRRINNQTSRECIDEIRKLYKDGGITIRELATLFGISKSRIHRLILGHDLDSQKETDTPETQAMPY